MHSLFHRLTSMQPDIFVRRLFVPRPLIPMPLPCPREIHFWYVLPNEVQNTSLLKQYLELLSPFERENILCMNGDKLQKGALLSRALVRTTLARYTNSNASPRSLKFRKSTYGKPEVEWPCDRNWVPPPLHFNVSHTSSLIACAVTADVPIGIDVEEKQRQFHNSILSFSRRYFSPSEVEFLCSFSETETQRQEFLKLWTLKEAYVKALGRGFSGAPFKDFAIQLKAKVMKDLSKPDELKIVVKPCRDTEVLTADWEFALFELATSHYAAICVKKNDTNGGGPMSKLLGKARLITKVIF
uniref:holo-[acyl-carrier-protein] synthase n=1 Tax=Anthurium amnicola TaxID=1678845 RepID=A0A1D1ZHG1_9ARAE